MHIVRTISTLHEAIKALRDQGKKIAFVPTMGALHAGHISLVDVAQSNADAVVVSIFVNPTQFGDGEDFNTYPRQEGDDIAKLSAAGVDIVWLPQVAEMYPDGVAADITASGNTDILCGLARPGHFNGVVTVVQKLLEYVQPDIAVFGEKDYQQLHIIRNLVQNERLEVAIIGAPIMREDDGLAMSSRNAYLTNEERSRADIVYKVLLRAKEAVEANAPDINDVINKRKSELEQHGFTVEYIELRDSETLDSASLPLEKPARLLIAVRLGDTRLIDNVEIIPSC